VASNKGNRPTNGFLKVSSRSFPASVAGAIAGLAKDGSPIELQAVGAGAVNQAIKAIAIARGFLSPEGYEIVCIPNFADIVIDGQYRTAIRLNVIAFKTSGRIAESLPEDVKKQIEGQSKNFSIGPSDDPKENAS